MFDSFDCLSALFKPEHNDLLSADEIENAAKALKRRRTHDPSTDGYTLGVVHDERNGEKTYNGFTLRQLQQLSEKHGQKINKDTVGLKMRDPGDEKLAGKPHLIRHIRGNATKNPEMVQNYDRYVRTRLQSGKIRAHSSWNHAHDAMAHISIASVVGRPEIQELRDAETGSVSSSRQMAKTSGAQGHRLKNTRGRIVKNTNRKVRPVSNRSEKSNLIVTTNALSPDGRRIAIGRKYTLNNGNIQTDDALVAKTVFGVPAYDPEYNPQNSTFRTSHLA